MTPSFYIQYHNEQERGPLRNGTSIESGRKNVLKAKGAICFIISGKGKSPKQFYLSSYFTIEKVGQQGDTYIASGKGEMLQPQVLLNNHRDFPEFIKSCGWFVSGFRSIDELPLTKYLASFVTKKKIPVDAQENDQLKDGHHYRLPTEIMSREEEKLYSEGKAVKVLANKYERNIKARKACINHYGATCYACELSFDDVYGDIADGFIHVHHITPLSKIGKGYKVDPTKDLIPLCANCHSVVHLTDPIMSIVNLKKRIKANKKR